MNPSLAPGTTLQLEARGLFSDNTKRNITASVTWASLDEDVATISNETGTRGLASSGAKIDDTTITATSGSITGSAILTCSPVASLGVSPLHSPSIAPGTTRQFSVTGILENGVTQNLTAWVTWHSSNEAVATVSIAPGSAGLATAVAAGSSSITAVFSGVTSDAAVLMVENLLSITVTPAGTSATLGTSRQFTATGTLSNNGTQDLTKWAAWSSSDENVALISNSGTSKGLATTVAEGSTTISASFNNVTGSTSFTVTPAVLTSIEIMPANASVPLGTTRQFAAVGTFSDGSVQDVTSSATWTSTNTGVATVSNETGSHGLVKTVSQGTTTIRAGLGSVTGSTTLTVTAPALSTIIVTPSNPSVVVGFLQQFVATGILTDGSTADFTASATWESSDPSVAIVSNETGSNGLAFTQAITGKTTITATVDGISGSTTLTVVLL